MLNKKKQLLSFVGLLIAALLWGVSYPLTKIVEDCPTFYIVSIRFVIAALALAIIFHKDFKKCNKSILKYAFWLSFCIASMYIFGTLGIKYTTSVRASFFTCLSFVIVPMINWAVFKIRLSKVIIISVLICLVGMLLLSYTSDMGTFMLNVGDLLCILAATAGAINIVFLDWASKRDQMEPPLFTFFLMAFVALWSTIIAIFTDAFAYDGTTVPQFCAIIALGLFCSAAAFLLQTLSQKYVPSNRAGIILAMEPASGCIISVLVLGETMHLSGWIGALLIMASLLYMEVASNNMNTLKKPRE